MSEDASSESAKTSEIHSADDDFVGLSPGELAAAAGPDVSWLWDGYLARGHITLLTSQWKSGKTTLVAVLLSKLKGGGTLAGQAVRPCNAAVISEEPAVRWFMRERRLGFGPVRFYCRPFRGRPTWRDWDCLIGHLQMTRAQGLLDLVVIDSLARFFTGRSENDAVAITDFVLPLHELTEEGASVLLLHHPRRKDSPVGQAARGSGALQGHVDVVLEMRTCAPAGVPSRRRRLTAQSYYEETPPDRVIELTEDGKDYLCLGDAEEASFADHWAALRFVLEGANQALTAAEILQGWPAHEARPAPTTLWGWLSRAAADGRLVRHGAGHRGDPHRYYLPGMPERWEEQRRQEAAPLRTVDAQEEMRQLFRAVHEADCELLRQMAGREGRSNPKSAGGPRE
jgi:hypothetical protein